MDRLPVELIRCIVDLVDKKAQLNLLCVGYTHYLIGIARLLSDITFYADPYTGNLTFRSAQLLGQLYRKRDIRGAMHNPMRLVRKVTVLSSPRPCFRVTPHAFRTLNMVFVQLLQNRYIQANLQGFQWRMGGLERLEKNPLPFPSCLRVLECVACQVDKTLTFPSLERLAVHRVRDDDGEWVSRQIQHSNLKELYLSGISSTDNITLSRFVKKGKQHSDKLKRIGLEYVHVDVWPWPPSTRLEELELRFCSQEVHQFRTCTSNMTDLETFTLVTEDDIPRWSGFKRMLWSCKKLKTLVLLLGGRTTKLPLHLIRPIQHSLETLVLEARLSSITPALNYEYTLEEVNATIAQMPNLKVLGLPIAMEEETEILSPSSHGVNLQVLHLRNWLYPQQTARILNIAAKYLAVVQNQTSGFATLMLAHGHSYRVPGVSGVFHTGECLGLEVEQVDDTLYRQYDISWIRAM